APLCRGHHRAKTHADNHIGNVYTWWNYESLGEGKYLWKGPKGTVLLRTNTGVYDVTDEHLSSGPRTPEQLSAPTTVEDVTAEARGSWDVSARVSSAEKTVHKIIAHLPTADA